MPNISSFGTQTDNAVVQGTVTDRQMIIPEVPPQGLMSVGPRVTPNFVKPREWNDKTTYHFFDAVRDKAGNAYVATKPVVPAGTPLTDEDYWFLWADPDTRFDDLNETVKTFNQRITQNTNNIATKAPINHASEETIYGIGNSVNYGHVRLSVDDTPVTSGANDGVAATPKLVHDSVVKNVVLFGDSWAADSPGIGVGQKLYDALEGAKTLVGNYAVAGAQFGDASFTTASSNTSAQLENAKGKLTQAQREAVTHVIMIAGVNNIGAKAPTVQGVANCWNAFKVAFPNARMFWLYSSMRSIYNGTTQGNVSRIQYDTFTQGARMVGVTVYDNSLVWLKTSNEANYWDGDQFHARHPNTFGIETYARIGAAAIDNGYDPQFITTVPINVEDAFKDSINYVDAYMIGTTVHLHLVLETSNTFNSKTKVASIPKLCWCTPQNYTRATAFFSDLLKVGYVEIDGKGDIKVLADSKSSAYCVIDLSYRIM